MKEPLMTRKEIMEVIPHRDPMLLLDQIIELELETSIEATFYVDPERDIFRGHFPGSPVLPGVYTVEIMAQASDVLLLSMARYQNTIPYFIGIDKVRFREKIAPGDTVVVKSRILSEREEKGIVTLFAQVYNKEFLACEGEVTLAMR